MANSDEFKETLGRIAGKIGEGLKKMKQDRQPPKSRRGRPMPHGPYRRGPKKDNDMRDHMPVKGSLEIVKVYPDGSEESLEEGPNLIVTDGREIVVELLSGDDAGADNKIITQIAWGDGGHVVASPTQAIPPQPSDAGLSNELLRKNLISHDFPETTTVRFVGLVDQTELNNIGISEVGLFSKDGKMFARKTFGLITKTADFSLEFRWRILA